MVRFEKTANGGIRFVIRGEAASKANSRRQCLNRKTGKTFWAKSEKALAFEAAVRKQAPCLAAPFTGRLSVTVTIYYRTERPDLDEALLLDALQGLVYKNDRQVREKHIYHDIDKADPRCEVEVTPAEPALFAPAHEGRAA